MSELSGCFSLYGTNLLCTLFTHICQARVVPVGYDSLRYPLKFIQIVHHRASKEGTAVFQARFINDNCRAFCFDSLHHSLNRALTEIIRITLHRQTVHADNALSFLTGTKIAFVVIVIISGHCQHPVGNKIFPCPIAFHNRPNQVFRHIRVVGQKLFGILGQAIYLPEADGRCSFSPSS